MSNSASLSVEDLALTSQYKPLSVIMPSLTHRRAIDLASIISLEELKLVKAVASEEGVSSKELAEKLNLSRSAAHKQARKLVEKKVLTCTEILFNKNIRPAHKYYITSGITSEIIELAIKLKEEADGVINVASSIILPPENSLGLNSADCNYQERIDSLKECLLSLPPPLQNTLKLLPANGISATEAAIQAKLDTTTIHKRLRLLVKLDWLTRESVSRDGESRSEYVYQLAHGITPELLEAAFKTLEEIENPDQSIKEKKPLENTSNSQEIRAKMI
ncbi:hypothetical protein NIES2101_37640 [Calothrix sp. HK-06]|nr:hypothetical protein NIES2101_37640 [Calothrix sp. HK-06]